MHFASKLSVTAPLCSCLLRAGRGLHSVGDTAGGKEPVTSPHHRRGTHPKKKKKLRNEALSRRLVYVHVLTPTSEGLRTLTRGSSGTPSGAPWTQAPCASERAGQAETAVLTGAQGGESALALRICPRGRTWLPGETTVAEQEARQAE